LEFIKTILYFQTIRLATLPVRSAHPGRFSFLMGYEVYNKPPLSIAQQIQLLKQRGLIFNDEDRAKRYLSFISLYRLRAYTYTYQNN